MKIKVSVIVPIYNVEKYLEKCLESLINQTLKEIEIICINDGSTDNSLNIIKNIMKKNNKIVLINKQNTGYGDSLNKGIEIAKGEYIGIVEPDDFVKENTFKKLVEYADKEKADIIRANFYYYSNKKIIKNEYIKNNEIIEKNKPNWLFVAPPAIWSAIYKKELIEKNKIVFLNTEGASYQDVGFYLKTLISAKKIYLVKDAFLYYRIDNENSSVKSNKKVFNVVKEHEDIKKYMIKNNLVNIYGRNIEAAKVANYIWNIQRLKYKNAKEFTKEIQKELINDKKEGLMYRKNFSTVHWLSTKFLIKFPRIFCIFVNIRNLFR